MIHTHEGTTVSDLLNGPPIGGRYPLHDTPAAVPSERLDETPEYRACTRRQLRLHMAFRLFCSVFAGNLTAAFGTAAKVRAWCWQQADTFLEDCDRTPPVAPASAAVMVTGGPHTPGAVKDGEQVEAA